MPNELFPADLARLAAGSLATPLHPAPGFGADPLTQPQPSMGVVHSRCSKASPFTRRSTLESDEGIKAKMLFFLIPLVLGFVFNLSSAFTMTFARWWGDRWGTLISVVLRDILGIPIWVTGFVLAARTSSPFLFGPTIVTEIVGWSTLVTGGVLILLALVTIRWRAARPSTCDALAQNGLYAHVRHPVHTGTFLEFVGLFLLRPSWPVGLACMLGCGWLLVQTKLEELDLVQRLPTYQEYMSRVPRFLPRIRIK